MLLALTGTPVSLALPRSDFLPAAAVCHWLGPREERLRRALTPH